MASTAIVPRLMLPNLCDGSGRRNVARIRFQSCPGVGQKRMSAGNVFFPSMSPSLNSNPLRISMSSADMDPGSFLLQQRIVFLGGQVEDTIADLIVSQLLLLDADDSTKDIKFIINSPGGSITAGMGIYDAMKLCKADVSTVCFGLAASMGAFLLASGTPGKRYCMPNSRVMIHQPLGSAGGSAIDIGLQVKEMMYHKVKLNKILSRATRKTEAQIEIDTDRDNFLNAWEAVEYGLADAVLGADREGLVAPIGENRAPPPPTIWRSWAVKDGKEKHTLPSESNRQST